MGLSNCKGGSIIVLVNVDMDAESRVGKDDEDEERVLFVIDCRLGEGKGDDNWSSAIVNGTPGTLLILLQCTY